MIWKEVVEAISRQCPDIDTEGQRKTIKISVRKTAVPNESPTS
jgi:hypothetical protein